MPARKINIKGIAKCDNKENTLVEPNLELISNTIEKGHSDFGNFYTKQKCDNASIKNVTIHEANCEIISYITINKSELIHGTKRIVEELYQKIIVVSVKDSN